MRKTGFLAVVALLISFTASAQTISGVINEYRKVVEFNNSGQGWVRITPDTSPYEVGDTVLLIQMKGAEIDQSNTIAYGDILDVNEAGNYEKNEICRIDGDTIFFRFDVINDYDPNGLVQLVTVPKFLNVTITGTLTADPWDGNVGGVLIFEAVGDVILEGDIDVSGLGFRGGLASGLEPEYGRGGNCSGHPYYSGDICGDNTNVFNCYDDKFFISDEVSAANFPDYVQSGFKGEGIAEFIDGQEKGNGKLATGGGGGVSHNAGGGGGSNYGAGGNGGKGWTFVCGPDAFINNGAGGEGLNNLASKVFLGGGGGGGHQNYQVTATDGEDGGGIVMITAQFLNVNGNHTINASGNTVTEVSVTPENEGDGAGGGGAGGSIILEVDNYNQVSGSLTIDASGGKGGDLVNGECLGPGGGGGGGVIISKIAIPAFATSNISGGDNGIVYEEDRVTPSVVCDPAHFSEPGEDGMVYEGEEIAMGTIDLCTPCIAPIVNISPLDSQVACTGETVTLTAIHNLTNESFAVYQWLRNGGAIPGANGNTYDASLPGNYSVEVLDNTQPNNPACPGVSPEVNFNVISKPTVQIFGADVLCAGDSVQLTAFTGLNVDLQWYEQTSGEIAGETDSLYFVKSPGEYYAIAGSGTCTTESNHITVNEAVVPEPDITADVTGPICDGEEVILTSNVQNTNFSYVWYRDGSAVFGGTGEFSFSATVSGEYYVQVTDPSAPSCAGLSDTIIVEVLDAPTVDVIGGGVYCEGNIQLSVIGANGGDITWYRNTSLINGEENETIVVTTGGTYRADVDLNGCLASDSTDVIISPNPTAGFNVTGDTDFCLGDSVTLEATPNGTGQFSYVWLRNDQIFTTDSAFTTYIDGVYKAVVLNDQGCSDTTDEIPVNVLPLPNATITGGGIVCEGETVQLSTSSANSYEWFKDGVTIPGADQQTYIATEEGLYKVLLSNGTCTDTSAEVEVIVEPTPVVTVFGPTTGCSNEEIQLGSTVTPADDPVTPTYLYHWYRDGQTAGVGIGHDTLDINLGGGYTLEVTKGQCVGSSPVYTVDIDIAPAAAIIPGDQVICTGDSALLVAFGSETDDYTWFINNVNAGISNDTIYAKTAGTYKVVVANGNCKDSTEVNVTMENNITVNITAQPSSVVCDMDSLLLSASSNISNPTFIWYEEPDVNPQGDGEQFYAKNTATYRVEAIAGNCQNDETIDIQVDNIDPVISETGICGTTAATLDAGDFGVANYDWYETDAIDNQSGTLVHDQRLFTTSTEGFYWVRVEKGGCVDSSNVIELLVSPVPTIEVVEIDTVCATLGIQLAAYVSGGTPPYSFVWSPDTYLDDPSSQYPLVNGLDMDVTFTGGVIDSKGCADTDDVFIDADVERFKIPNIFTPNGDGINDFFVIKGVEQGGKLRIANRWGDTVYYIKEYDNTWSGEDLNDGVYYYIYVSPCDDKEYKGWVQILR